MFRCIQQKRSKCEFNMFIYFDCTELPLPTTSLHGAGLYSTSLQPPFSQFCFSHLYSPIRQLGCRAPFLPPPPPIDLISVVFRFLVAPLNFGQSAPILFLSCLHTVLVSRVSSAERLLLGLLDIHIGNG